MGHGVLGEYTTIRRHDPEALPVPACSQLIGKDRMIERWKRPYQLKICFV